MRLERSQPQFAKTGAGGQDCKGEDKKKALPQGGAFFNLFNFFLIT